MKTLFASLIALVALAWGWAFSQAVAPTNVHALWLARQELLYLSGLLSVVDDVAGHVFGDAAGVAGSPVGWHGPHLPQPQVGWHSGGRLCRDCIG